MKALMEERRPFTKNWVMMIIEQIVKRLEVLERPCGAFDNEKKMMEEDLTVDEDYDENNNLMGLKRMNTI